MVGSFCLMDGFVALTMIRLIIFWHMSWCTLINISCKNVAFLSSVVDNRHYRYFLIAHLVSSGKWFAGSLSYNHKMGNYVDDIRSFSVLSSIRSFYLLLFFSSRYWGVSSC